MTELEKIKQAFHDQCHCNPQNVISEKFDDGTEMTRRICDDGYSTFLVRLETDDDSFRWYPYFRKGTGLSQVCDFFLFVELDNCTFALLIELKKGQESPFPQLELSENFVKFVLRRMMLSDKLRLVKPVYIRKIGVSDRPAPKRPTKYFKENRPVEKGNFQAYDDNNCIKCYNDTKLRISLHINMPTLDPAGGAVDLLA